MINFSNQSQITLITQTWLNKNICKKLVIPNIKNLKNRFIKYNLKQFIKLN